MSWTIRSTRTRRAAAIDASTALVLAAVVVVLCLIATLPYVGRQRAARAGVARVEIWAWNIAAKSLAELAPSFEAAHPSVELDVKMSGTAMQSRFLLAMASNRGAPDVMQLQEREAGKYTATRRLADLTPWAAKYERDFPTSFWQSCVDDGKVYAVPWDVAPCAVFYKRWIFDRYGIDPALIETWDDLVAAGAKILAASKGETKLMPLAPNGLSVPFQTLMQQNGGGIFDARGRIIFDSPANLETLELIRRMLDSGTCSPISTGQEMKVSYNDDSIACYPVAVWNMIDMKEASKSHAGQWGVFRLPAFRPGGLRNSNQGGSVLVVPAQSAHGPQAEAFIEQAVCTVDGALQQWQHWSLFPAYLPALRDPRFDVPDPFFGGQHVATLFARDIDRVPPLTRTADWDEAEQYVGRTLYDWARTRQDSAAYLRETARGLGERLRRDVASPAPLAAPR